MGCVNNKPQTYSDHQYDEETELRKFEEEIGAFRKNLNHVLPRICIEKDIIPISNLEDYIHKDFTENFVQLIRQGYFYKEINGQKFYDARKINLLLFLLTNDTLVNNGKLSYHDKASFLFTFVKTREDQNLCEALEENEENFIKFVEDLVEISCEGIVDCYVKLKNVNREGTLNKMKLIKPDVVKMIIKNLFFNKNAQQTGGLTFEEINKKFGEDKYIFTSGYIRDYAWQILVKGKANELEAKDREEASKEITK